MTGGAGDADLFVFAITTDMSGDLMLLSDNDVIIDFKSNDFLGFLDYSDNNILADNDTGVQDFTLDVLGALGTDVTINEGTWDGGTGFTVGSGQDLQLVFEGGGTIVMDGPPAVSDTVITDLFNAGQIQVIDAIV